MLLLLSSDSEQLEIASFGFDGERIREDGGPPRVPLDLGGKYNDHDEKVFLFYFLVEFPII